MPLDSARVRTTRASVAGDKATKIVLCVDGRPTVP